MGASVWRDHSSLRADVDQLRSLRIIGDLYSGFAPFILFSSAPASPFGASLAFAACFFVLLLVARAFCQIVLEFVRQVFGRISEI